MSDSAADSALLRLLARTAPRRVAQRCAAVEPEADEEARLPRFLRCRSALLTPAGQGAQLVAEAQRVLVQLGTRRDMSINEVRLVLMVEDPRATQRREQYGIEVESGVSRNEILAALTDVQSGRVPADRLALRQLVSELQGWPYLESDEALRGEGPSPYAEVTNTGLSKAQRLAQAQRAQGAAQTQPEAMEEASEKDLSDFLPKWVGFSAVYLISAIPVFITVAVLTLLFITSLK